MVFLSLSLDSTEQSGPVSSTQPAPIVHLSPTYARCHAVRSDRTHAMAFKDFFDILPGIKERLPLLPARACSGVAHTSDPNLSIVVWRSLSELQRVAFDEVYETLLPHHVSGLLQQLVETPNWQGEIDWSSAPTLLHLSSILQSDFASWVNGTVHDAIAQLADEVPTDLLND